MGLYTLCAAITMVVVYNISVSFATEVKNVTRKGASSVPRNIPNDVEMINLTNGTLTIGDDAFARFELLKTLILSNNSIKYFPSTCIKGTQLNKLDLSRNLLSEFGNYEFIKNTLKILILQYNQIKQIPDNLPTMLPSLKTLQLAYNKINMLPANMITHISEKIGVDSNNISSLPDGYFVKADSLTMFEIHKNPLATFPDLNALGLPPQNKIRTFYIGYVTVFGITENALAPLQKVQYLSLAGTKLTSFPNLHRKSDSNVLKYVNLDWNDINTILENDIKNAKITRLELRGNTFETFPDLTGADFSYFRQIDLAKNLIKTIDTAILSHLLTQAPNLENIDLSDPRDNKKRSFQDLSDVLCFRNPGFKLTIDLRGTDLDCKTMEWIRIVNCSDTCNVTIYTDDLCNNQLSCHAIQLRVGKITGTSFWNENMFALSMDGNLTSCHQSGYETDAKLVFTMQEIKMIESIFIQGGPMENPVVYVRNNGLMKSCVHLMGKHDFSKGVTLTCMVPIKGDQIMLMSTYAEATRMRICEFAYF